MNISIYTIKADQNNDKKPIKENSNNDKKD